MAFATRCPQCSTVFQVTGEQLAQCSGMVRCGICKTPFNGIERLIGRISPRQEIPVGTQPPAVEETPIAQPATAVPESAPPTGMPQESLPEQLLPPAETVAASTVPSDLEPVDSGEPVPLTDAEKSLQEAFDRQLQSFSLEIETPKEPVIADTSDTPPALETTSPVKTEPVLTDSAPALPLEDTPSPAPRKRHSFLGGLLWFFIIVVLLLAAGLAAIYYYGREITEEVPALEETVDTVCEQLSCPVETPPATPPVTAGSDLTLTYEAPVKDTIIPGSFNQKLSLANTGRQKLPWPELRLEITDAKGGTLLSERMLKPKDYLSEALSKTDGIEPATKHDLQLHFEFKHPAAAVNSRITVSNPSTPTH